MDRPHSTHLWCGQAQRLGISCTQPGCVSKAAKALCSAIPQMLPPVQPDLRPPWLVIDGAHANTRTGSAHLLSHAQAVQEVQNPYPDLKNDVGHRQVHDMRDAAHAPPPSCPGSRSDTTQGTRHSTPAGRRPSRSVRAQTVTRDRISAKSVLQPKTGKHAATRLSNCCFPQLTGLKIQTVVLHM